MGVIVNPHTLRKVQDTGKIGKKLIRDYGGEIRDVDNLVSILDPWHWLYILLNHHNHNPEDEWFYKEAPKEINRVAGKDMHMRILKYKMSRGVYRPFLLGHAKKLNDDIVAEVSKKAFAEKDPMKAVEVYKQLKGTGYALASAVISASTNGKIPFMSDELLTVATKNTKFKYTLDEYMKCVELTKHISSNLNKKQTVWKWTTSEIEKVIYLVTHR